MAIGYQYLQSSHNTKDSFQVQGVARKENNKVDVV